MGGINSLQVTQPCPNAQNTSEFITCISQFHNIKCPVTSNPFVTHGCVSVSSAIPRAELASLGFSWSCRCLQHNVEQTEEPIAVCRLTWLCRTMSCASWAPWSLSLLCAAAGGRSCCAAAPAALRQSVQGLGAAHHTQKNPPCCGRCCTGGNSECQPSIT